MDSIFDIIVIGAGHAGVEAAHASAFMGKKTLMLTHSLDTIGQMSCNPSLGGIGKGHIIKEIDALGGIMARAGDLAGIQFRTLNSSKGKAVRATRAQIDRSLYKQAIVNLLSEQTNLHILEQTVDNLIINNYQIEGVITKIGLKFKAPIVIIATGTFLNGRIHIGLTSFSGGRSGHPASLSLASSLKSMGLHPERLKTGTPPRIDRNTINYSKLVEQPGDFPLPLFSFLGNPLEHPPQCSCFITQTNIQTHEIILKNLDRSPLFTGVIEGIGPRYCPSIEDKIHRFPDRVSHQIFLEPEGLKSGEIYPNGISTSLPFDVQVELVRSIKGLEEARLIRPGYAIEYDFFDPKNLNPTLETKNISGLFFAGQINGTTGYEEAAAQGLIAGINASLKLNHSDPWYPKRNEAYIGVMLDDLVVQGITEPYRMFTSRAEYRLMLREDNADLRLTPIAHGLGCIDDKRYERFIQKCQNITSERKRLENTWIKKDSHESIALSGIMGQILDKDICALHLLRRSEITCQQLLETGCFEQNVASLEILEQIEIQEKYRGYIDRQLVEIDRQRKYEELIIPKNFNYDLIKGLSNEVLQKLNKHRPLTLGQASRISGMTPAAISILLVYLRR